MTTATTIVAVEASPLDLPLTEPFAVATGAQPHAANVLVRVRLGDGTVGLGEAAPFPAVSGETQATATRALEDIGAAVTGMDVSGWRAVAARAGQAAPDEPAARCGLDMAVLDALGRSSGLSLVTFFGGADIGRDLETDMTVTAGDVAHAERAARAIVSRGIGAIKIKVGALDPGDDAERVRAVARAAPDARLYADANGGYTAGAALSFLEALDRHGVALALFEQPVAREDWAGLAEVARHTPIPICADESARSPADVLRLASEGSARVINIKLMKCGVDGAMRIWSIARAAGLDLMIGAMVEGVLATTFSACFALGMGAFTYVDLDTPLFVREHPFEGGIAYEGGRMRVDARAHGHGVRLRAA